MHNRALATITFAFLLAILLVPIVLAATIEIDKTGTVSAESMEVRLLLILEKR
jgi:hypothetical protein